jgi:4-amino-4-deoxy-L-arabinose transferase-like glycosyltransferase
MAKPTTKAPPNAPPSPPWDSEVRLLAWLATCVSVLSFLFYFQRGDVLLYGDAIAHMNIARRVFDSKTPGLLQLGTVWLPLPHLLMIPFLISHEMWQRGAGGSLPSLVAYVFGVVGMFRLVRGSLESSGKPDAAVRAAAWTAAVVYAANPNLIYMQTTAMGESLYLAFFIWAVVYFGESQHEGGRALTKCGLCLAAACMTRYDGWFLAVAMAAVLAVLTFRAYRADGAAGKSAGIQRQPKAVLKFMLIAAAAPTLWLAYNGIVYRNPLEFENGPYSAKAIERKTQTAGNPGHPGSGNLLVAGLYFVKSGEASVAENPWLQRSWVVLALVALVAVAGGVRSRRNETKNGSRGAWLVLLWLLVPLPFYALSVAYGGVPIFVPAWWPFSHYNVRYGLQLLPAFAAALAIFVYLAMRTDRLPRRLRMGAILGAFVCLIASYASIWRAGPVCLKEAQINMRGRNHLEAQLAGWLHKLPPDSTLLMYLGDHVGAVEQAGIPLKQVINEGNHRVWKQPVDPVGLWERALANPAQYTDFVVAFEGDPVWQAVQQRHLPELVEIHTTGQARAIIYRSR